MEKTVESIDTAKEMARLNEEKRALEKQIRGYRGRQARLEHEINVLKPDSSQKKPEGAQIESEIVAKSHPVHVWEPFCVDCGQKNPDFKNMALCKDCGLPLGTWEISQKLDACPNCGSTKARALKLGKQTGVLS